MSAFIDALARASVPVIMELKPRDADGRDLFAGRTPAQLVATYERLGAPCLSVVTGSWFGGDDALLREVATLTERPILKKDFVTSERQIAAAKAQGASAVLLTAELLPGSLTARLAAACRRHCRHPVRRDRRCRPARAARRRPRLRGRGQQQGHPAARARRGADRAQPRATAGRAGSGAECAVSAGGIADSRAAARLLDAGYDALLIGTALLAGCLEQQASRRGRWRAGGASRRHRSRLSALALGAWSRDTDSYGRGPRTAPSDPVIRDRLRPVAALRARGSADR